MPQFGRTRYPDTVDKIMGNKDVEPAFVGYCLGADKVASTMARFLYNDQYKSPETVYEHHFKPGAAYAINIPEKIRALLDDYFADGYRYHKKEIERIYDVPRKVAVKACNNKAIKDFYKSQSFADFHVKKVTKHRDFSDLVKTAQKKLKLTKPKSIATMEEVLEEALFGNYNGAKAMAKKLSKTGRFGPLGNRDIFKEMEKYKLV